MSALLSAVVSYTVKFIILIGVAVGGFVLGRTVKHSKKTKN